MLKVIILFFILHFINISQTIAQYKGTLGIDLQYVPTKNIFLNSNEDSIAGNYGSNQFQIQGNIPIYQYKNILNSKFKYIQLITNYGVSYQDNNLSLFTKEHHIMKPNLGITGSAIYGKKSMWIGGLHTFFSNDLYSISKPTFRIAGIGIYQRKVNEKFSFRLGVIYSSSFGKMLALPILGVRIKTSDKSNWVINLPFNFIYNHNKSSHFSYQIYLRQYGQFATLSNKFGEFNTLDEEVNFRNSESRLGWSFTKLLSSRWILKGNISLATRRKLYISENIYGTPNNILSLKVNPNLYSSMGVYFLLGKKSTPIKIHTIPVKIEDIDLQEYSDEDLL